MHRFGEEDGFRRGHCGSDQGIRQSSLLVRRRDGRIVEGVVGVDNPVRHMDLERRDLDVGRRGRDVGHTDRVVERMDRWSESREGEGIEQAECHDCRIKRIGSDHLHCWRSWKSFS